ncbi:MAG: alpha-galactosidase D [Prevotella sp.]
MLNGIIKNKTRLAVLLASAFTLTLSAQPYEKPTMGWSSWNTYRVNISADLIMKQADAMAQQGLKEVGYKYINIDDGFFGGRDSNGRLLVHAARFPNGLEPVVKHVHSLGFKAGIYSDAGHNTCGNFWDKDEKGDGVGLYGHDQQDADYFFKRLKFDFIKIDFCGGDAAQNTEHLDLDEKERYTAIRKAIDNTGRKDVRINVCRWNFPGTWVHNVGSSWRMDADISPDWNAVKRIIAKNRYLSAYATEGHYNDMDMLEIGLGLSDAEERTHFGMWCIQSSPLLIGCDMTTIPTKSLELLKNKELIAINQDELALQAYVVKQEEGVSLYVKDIQTLNGTKRAVAIYNPTENEHNFELKMGDVDLDGTVKVRDVFAHKDMPKVENGIMNVNILPHDTRIFVLNAEKRNAHTIYEAETAWLERFQCLGINNSLGYANYADSECCSGGAKVEWLGNNKDNYMEWRNVFCSEDGVYNMILSYVTNEDRSVYCSVNGNTDFEIKTPGNDKNCVRTVSCQIRLKKGMNTIRLGNADAWCPDIDKIEIARL